MTGSGFYLGLAGFLRSIPQLFLSVPGGILADRSDRRRLLGTFQGLAAGLTCLMALLIASLAVLAISGDQFVIGAGRLASALRVRPTVIGAVIGGLGASLPELLVSGVASAHRSTQLWARLIRPPVNHLAHGFPAERSRTCR